MSNILSNLQKIAESIRIIIDNIRILNFINFHNGNNSLERSNAPNEAIAY